MEKEARLKDPEYVTQKLHSIVKSSWSSSLIQKSRSMVSRLSQITAFKPRQNLNRLPCLLLRETQFVETLQIQPKFRARAKEMAKA